jgi:glycosyltransferase involved in cell wall biosynthesis
MGNQPGRVDILLATYNGERFIERQLDSILPQIHSGCRLLVRDDGSSDKTVPILKRFAAQQPDRIVVLDDGCPRQGACQSFARLLRHSDADYVALCDQDDVWLPGRIDRPLERIQAVEKRHGTDMPVLAHTDLVVVDQNLRTISPSFWSYSNLDSSGGRGLNRLLVQNAVTGCASLMNRALVRLASPIPNTAVPMHDWWLALVASAFGRIESIPEATVLYRQHPRNCLGATRYDIRYVIRRAWEVLFGGGVSRRLQVSQRQARIFLRRFASQLNQRHRELLKDFLSLRSVSSVCRRRLMMKHHFFGYGRLRNLAWLMMI